MMNLKVSLIWYYVFTSLGFKNFTTQVSLRDKKNAEKYIGDEGTWENAEKAIINAAQEKNLDFTIVEGEAAF